MVNIIIPVYNGAEKLGEALKSLVAQTCNRFFVTIVDDCSQEDLLPTINKFQDFLTIKYIRKEKNEGCGPARQTGIDYNNSLPLPADYLIFLDSDDLLYNKAVDILQSEIKRSGADFVFSKIEVEKEGREIEYFEESKNTTWMHGKIYNRDFFNKYNIRFLPTLRNNEDSYFNLVCFILASSIKYIDQPLYIWRNNKESLTRSEKGYFFNHNYEYLISQIEACKKIIQEDPSKNVRLSATICNIYSSYENLCLTDKDNIENANRQLDSLFVIKLFRDIFLSPEALLNVSANLKQSIVESNMILFFKHSFNSFCNFFGIKLGEDE